MSAQDKEKGIQLSYTVQSPGWPVVLWLLSQLEQEAVDQCMKFEGWDKDSKAALMDRMQAVKHYREEFLKRVNIYLLAGQASGADNTREDAQAADELRQQIETRIPGTY